MTGERVELANLRSLAPPTVDQAHLWLCRLGDSSAHIDALHSLLSRIELDQAARFTSVEARNRFLIGRGMLRSLLGAYLSVPTTDVAIAIDPGGKPRLAETWDDISLAFNSAHSGDLLLLGFTCGSEIGVDIEHHRPVAQWQGIAERHYSRRELAALRAARTEEQQELFFRVWTRKEAVLKWHGTGLQTPLSSIEVPIETRCQAWVELPQSRDRCWVQQIDGPAGYSAALATSFVTTQVVQREAGWT